MKSHRKMITLHAFYQSKDLQARQSLYLVTLNRNELLRKLQELNAQQIALKLMIKEYDYADCTDRTTLFNEMRKVAVLRRKYLNMGLEYQKTQDEIEALDSELKDLHLQLLALHNKSKKFLELIAKSKIVQLRKTFSEEETEIEEFLS